MINDDKKPIYVAVNDSDICVGYAFVSYRNRRFKKDCKPLTPSFKVRILITSKASNIVLSSL